MDQGKLHSTCCIHNAIVSYMLNVHGYTWTKMDSFYAIWHEYNLNEAHSDFRRAQITWS